MAAVPGLAFSSVSEPAAPWPKDIPRRTQSFLSFHSSSIILFLSELGPPLTDAMASERMCANDSHSRFGVGEDVQGQCSLLSLDLLVREAVDPHLECKITFFHGQPGGKSGRCNVMRLVADAFCLLFFHAGHGRLFVSEQGQLNDRHLDALFRARTVERAQGCVRRKHVLTCANRNAEDRADLRRSH